jgi:hypothetical protein
MRRLIGLALTIVAFAALASAVHAVEFTDKSTNFCVDVPSNWTVDETTDVANFSGPEGLAQINISKTEAKGVTLEDFAKAFPEALKEELSKFKLISTDNTKVGKLPAITWVYTAVVGGVTLEFKNTVVLRGDSIYTVVFCTLPDRYTGDVEGFDHVIKSWSWSVS